MALSYSPSDLNGPDACEILSEADVQALLSGPPEGFARRQADLAENRISLNDGKTTYFTATTCERALARTGDVSFGVSPKVSLHTADLSLPGVRRGDDAART